MTQVKELVFSKDIFVRTREIYPLSLDIMDNMSAFGDIIERRHVFESDGPRRRVHLFFDLIERIDDHAAMVFSFLIDGEEADKSYLKIRVEGSTLIELKQGTTFGSIIFNSFYADNIFPIVKKNMENRVQHMEKFIEKKIEKLNFKYA